MHPYTHTRMHIKGTILEGPKGNPNGVEGVDHIGGLTWEDVPAMLLECKPPEGQRR